MPAVPAFLLKAAMGEMAVLVTEGNRISAQKARRFIHDMRPDQGQDQRAGTNSALFAWSQPCIISGPSEAYSFMRTIKKSRSFDLLIAVLFWTLASPLLALDGAPVTLAPAGPVYLSTSAARQNRTSRSQQAKRWKKSSSLVPNSRFRRLPSARTHLLVLKRCNRRPR